MGSEWPQKALKTVGVSLIDCVHKTPPVADVGFPYIAIPQMSAGCIDFNASPRLISEADLIEWTKKADPKKDDIVLSRRCNPGETAYVDGSRRFALGQNLVLLRSTSGCIYPPFLRWIVRSPFWWEQVAKYLNVGAVFDSLRCADIPKFELPIPPITDQKSIAHILGTLDDKIELNRQMNATLESMAQALFKSWFVDFDPVIDNALAAGNPIPPELAVRAEGRKSVGATGRSPLPQNGTLPEHIRAQFPDRFVLTEEMGWVPEGWESGTLGMISEVIGGFAFKSKDFCDTGCPVIKIKNIQDNRRVDVSDVQHIPRVVAPTASKFWLKNGDLLMAMTGATVGKYGLLVGASGQDYLLNQRVAKFIPRSEITNQIWFTYCLLMEGTATSHIVNNAHGSAQPNISANGIMDAPSILPANEIVQLFTTKVSPLFRRVLKCQKESDVLSRLRDTLLPKLLSGELRIPDAEKQIDEAL
ncbi:Uncharacterised protein [Zhongshania aliphaticivorans]|uniref:Type I restriction modification DNA specificity domain-containing protein n=1 Tax=Zhongshania aliphaticivorans TaxID=1470434 RepID=A0A5S9NFC8_9GAMM|nr:restriction endonuclease subunit S [Zhongshania aliphaticivorans]CAA0088549.1 Uncharacterised protein [Zhongshania aliphaticivorans]CAA0094618.1 Uncharacterised protein [Zhongshania aliphaticivorans]